MSATADRSARRTDAPTSARTGSLGLAGALLLVFALALWVSLPRHLNNDSAWFVYAIGRMLDGDRLYVDIMEVNPPLFFWLMTPPIALARWSGADAVLLFKLWTMLLAAASTGLTGLLARRLLGRTLPAMIATLATAVALALLPAWDFGQREHVSLILAMPYVFLQALRREGLSLSPALAVCAGVMAGLGFGLKPYMLAVPLVLEVFVQWGRWRPGLLFRPENLALGGVLVGYVALVWLFVPAYFDSLLPLALATYHAGHTISWREFLAAFLYANPRLNILFFLMAAGLVWLVRTSRMDSGRRALVLGLLVAAVGYELSWILQGTPWGYLAYPSMALATVAVLVAVADYLLPERGSSASFSASRLVQIVLIVAVALPLLVAVYFRYPYDRYMDYQRRTGLFTPDVRSIYIFTTRMSEAFPFVNETGLIWASRYPYLWPLPAIVNARRSGRMTPELEEAERRLLSTVVEDLERHRPDLLLVSTSSEQNFIAGRFDYLAYFAKAPGFAEIMRSYRLVKRTPHHAFYRRITP